MTTGFYIYAGANIPFFVYFADIKTEYEKVALFLVAALVMLQSAEAQIRLRGVSEDLINPVLFDGARWIRPSWICCQE